MPQKVYSSLSENSVLKPKSVSLILSSLSRCSSLASVPGAGFSSGGSTVPLASVAGTWLELPPRSCGRSS